MEPLVIEAGQDVLNATPNMALDSEADMIMSDINDVITKDLVSTISFQTSLVVSFKLTDECALLILNEVFYVSVF